MKNPDFGFLPDPVLHVSVKIGHLSIKLSKNVGTYKSSLKTIKHKKIKLIIVIFQKLEKALLFSHIVGSRVNCKYVHGKYHKKLYFLKHFYIGISVRTTVCTIKKIISKNTTGNTIYPLYLEQ